MQYLTYATYVNMGGECDSIAFIRNIDRACGIIDNATHNRIEQMKEVPHQAKALCRDLVTYLAQNKLQGTTVTSRSQSADGVSESESYGVRSADDMYGDIQNMLFDYLGELTSDKGTPLLYRGCRD